MRENPLKYGQRNEGSGYLDKREPVGVMAIYAHRLPPAISNTAFRGISQVTATGNRRALGLAKQVEDAQPKQLPPVREPKRIEPPKQKKKNGFDRPLDDEIPF